MSWLFLLLAGVFEIGFTTSLKMSDGFSFQRPQYIVVFTTFALLSFGMLNLAIKEFAGSPGIPLGIAYAVWTGIGAVGTVLIGIYWFHDSMKPLQIIFLGLLIASIIGLKIVSPN